MAQRFGGAWTKDKLVPIERYLAAYTTALKNQPFEKVYVDAFAGTGYVELKAEDNVNPMFPEFSEIGVQEFVDGSARIALGIEPPFDRYLFVEKNYNRSLELRELEREFPQHKGRIHVSVADANDFLMGISAEDWRSKRAVVFLDPYGMQVKWHSIEALASTKAIDVWILFPLGVAVNRLLRRDGRISDSVRRSLNDLFGTEDWFDEFFKPSEVRSLFEFGTEIEKTANFDSIGQYFNRRLSSVFAGVAPNPLKLYNSKSNPLYLLCFAVGNPKARQLALRLASHILAMK